MHYISDHPEILAERKKRKQSDWLPEGVKVQHMKHNADGTITLES
jgi:hypothetical protein